MSSLLLRIIFLAIALSMTLVAGTFLIGNSTSSGDFITFSAPDITIGVCPTCCFFMGRFCSGPVAIDWSLTISDQEGATMPFNLSDELLFGESLVPGSDQIAGNILLTSATETSTGGDLTNLAGTFTFTTVNVAKPVLLTAFQNFCGPLPQVGSQAIDTLSVNCASSTPCITADPLGEITNAALTSTAPEPGTLAC